MHRGFRDFVKACGRLAGLLRRKILRHGTIAKGGCFCHDTMTCLQTFALAVLVTDSFQVYPLTDR